MDTLDEHIASVLHAARESRRVAIRNTIVVLLVVLLIFFAKALLSGVLVRILVISLCLPCCLLALLYIRKAQEAVSLTLLFSAMWLAICVAVVTTGLLLGPTISWFPISICLAGLLGGWRFCIRWTIIVSVTCVGLWAAHFYLPAMEALVVSESKALHARMHIFAQICVMATSVLSFVRTNSRYERKVIEQYNLLAEEVRSRRLAEQAALESSAAKTQFLANMSHEIRTPLNSVIGYSKRLLIKASGAADSKDKSALECIHRNGKGLLVLFNELLEYASLGPKSLVYNEHRFSINGLMEECLEAVIPVASDYGLKVDFQASDNVEVSADRSLIAQVINALIYFCVRQTAEGGIEVFLCSASRNHVPGVSIKVVDSSYGITEKQQQSLFDTHYELVFNSNKELPISAMSMVLAAKAVRLHGGEIAVQSQLGVGVQFTVWLPCEKPRIEDRHAL